MPGDALALKALTGLTKLQLNEGQDGVGTAAATAIAGNLRQLRHLELCNCEIDQSSKEFLAALAQLTQLTELQLQENHGMLTPRRLMQLTGLRRLRKLRVENTNGVTRDAWAAFWAAVRQ